MEHTAGMKIAMNHEEIKTIEDVIRLNNVATNSTFNIQTAKERYEFISYVLTIVTYPTLRKRERTLVKKFLKKVTDYSDIQLNRLIASWKKKGLLACDHKSGGRHNFTYTPEDVALLIKTDILHKTQNGLTTKAILMREVSMFGHTTYNTIAKISVSHIYNLRKHNRQYLTSEAIKYSKTNPVDTNIGERRKPRPYGKPGYIRIDSVHQGDLDSEKGVYHINLVDEVTQWELVGCVPAITDEFMEPLIERLLEAFPFIIINFHSDNGSEYINHTVASILRRLLIKQTKSRSRQSTDNALVEGKNGAVIRKHMGRNFIDKDHAGIINNFYADYFNVYLNYHRVCLYATDYIDKRGKIRKKYNQTFVPYERFKSLENAEQYLKSGISFAELDVIAYALSDNQFAEMMQKAKSELQKLIKNASVEEK